MDSYKERFIDFLLENNALEICNNPDREDGCYVLKSGRISPFFMNMGKLNGGEQLLSLGEAYAEAIFANFGKDFDLVFGPAYKGIPLAVAASMQFSSLFGYSPNFCANRKEVKDHGDSGIILGRKPQDGDRVVIVEDVTTSGKSIDETVPILKSLADVKIGGLVVSLNRLEYGSDKSKTALEELSEKYGIKTTAIISMQDVAEYLKARNSLTIDIKSAIKEYYHEYGADSIHMGDWRW